MAIIPRPVRKDMVTSGILGCVGDILCQTAVERRPVDGIDAQRTVAITAFNTIYIGSFLHYLYQLFPPIVVRLGRYLRAPALIDKSTTAHALGCTVVDNFHNGIVYIPAYFFTIGTLEGGSFSEASRALRREWLETYSTCTVFWIPFTWFNFAVISKSRRVRFMALGNLVWSIFIDWLAHRHPS